MEFFVYKDIPGLKEEEEYEKVLFYSPRDLPMDVKTRKVGLSEALVNLSGTFSKDEPISSMHTQQKRWTFYTPEKDIWLVLITPNPASKNADSVTYDQEQQNDELLQEVVKQAYKMFRLFNGCIENILEAYCLRTLRSKLEHFFDPYLANVSISNATLFNTLDGILFLPVDRNTYMSIQYFINLVETSFEQIKHSAFLFDSHLVWSSLEQDDMRVLYKHVVELLSKDSDGSSPGYVTGPEELEDPDTAINAPRVHVGANASEEYHLIIYKQHHVTLMLLIDLNHFSDMRFYKDLHDMFLFPKLGPLAKVIGEQFAIIQKIDSYKYIYFNHMNIALKSSVSQTGAISPELMTALNQIHEEFVNGRESVTEVCIKNAGDCWAVGRKIGAREIFVVFDEDSYDLSDIDKEMVHLCDSYFNNVFIE